MWGRHYFGVAMADGIEKSEWERIQASAEERIPKREWELLSELHAKVLHLYERKIDILEPFDLQASTWNEMIRLLDEKAQRARVPALDNEMKDRLRKNVVLGAAMSAEKVMHVRLLRTSLQKCARHGESVRWGGVLEKLVTLQAYNTANPEMD